MSVQERWQKCLGSLLKGLLKQRLMSGTSSPTQPVVRVNLVTAPEAPGHPAVGSAGQGSPDGRHGTSARCWDAISTRDESKRMRAGVYSRQQKLSSCLLRM